MIVNYRIELVELMKELGLPLSAVEVGVAEGRFSLELLQAGIQELYLVDRWACEQTQRGDGGFPQQWHDTNYSDARDRLSKYRMSTSFLKGDSVEMSKQVDNKDISMVYLDGDHSYTGVMRDLNAWYQKVVPGGIVAFHDYLNVTDYGVKQAAEEFCIANGYTIDELIVIPENDINDAGAYFIKH